MGDDILGDFRYDARYTLLRGVQLQFKRYQIYSEDWDHDHCTRCSAKFAEFDGPEILHYGYATCEDYIHGAEYEWICEECFAFLSPLMEWEVVGDSPERVRQRYKENLKEKGQAPE